MAADFEDLAGETIEKLSSVASQNPKKAYQELNNLPKRLFDKIMEFPYYGNKNQRKVRQLLLIIEPPTQYMNSKNDFIRA
mgnify:FL=1